MAPPKETDHEPVFCVTSTMAPFSDNFLPLPSTAAMSAACTSLALALNAMGAEV
jgi:hypothetical protein